MGDAHKGLVPLLCPHNSLPPHYFPLWAPPFPSHLWSLCRHWVDHSQKTAAPGTAVTLSRAGAHLLPFLKGLLTLASPTSRTSEQEGGCLCDPESFLVRRHVTGIVDFVSSTNRFIQGHLVPTCGWEAENGLCPACARCLGCPRTPTGDAGRSGKRGACPLLPPRAPGAFPTGLHSAGVGVSGRRLVNRPPRPRRSRLWL